jgi:signal transduction histidine kinase
MTEDEIALAMQPFRQLDTAPRRQTGTGLGLPLTKALAEANRARFELTSERGAGTTADVVFPADRLVDRPALA